MIATIRETVQSLGDLNYGKVIVKKSVGQAFWYWVKYPLTIATFVLVAIVALTVYFAPQVPRLAERALPAGEFVVKDGQASTTMKQPFVWEDSNFGFVFDLENGQEADLDAYDQGVAILKDRVIAKGDDGLRVIRWSDLEGDFSFSKQMAIDWLSANKMVILTVLLILGVILVALSLGLYVAWEALSFMVSALVFWLVAKVLKVKATYADIYKLVVYAAVPALLVQALNLLLPNQLLAILSLGVFVFYAAAWLYRLPKKTK